MCVFVVSFVCLCFLSDYELVVHTVNFIRLITLAIQNIFQIFHVGTKSFFFPLHFGKKFFKVGHFNTFHQLSINGVTFR